LEHTSERNYAKSHHQLVIARLAAAATERILEVAWLIQNAIWYYTHSRCEVGFLRAKNS
jgi:hypothetical protein